MWYGLPSDWLPLCATYLYEPSYFWGEGFLKLGFLKLYLILSYVPTLTGVRFNNKALYFGFSEMYSSYRPSIPEQLNLIGSRHVDPVQLYSCYIYIFKFQQIFKWNLLVLEKNVKNCDICIKLFSKIRMWSICLFVCIILTSLFSTCRLYRDRQKPDNGT